MQYFNETLLRNFEKFFSNMENIHTIDLTIAAMSDKGLDDFMKVIKKLNKRQDKNLNIYLKAKVFDALEKMIPSI